MFSQLTNFIGNYCESPASLTGAGRLNGGIESQQVGLLGNVIDHVDDFRNFQGPVTQSLDAFCGGLHRRTDALHAFQRVMHGAVALFGGVKGAARSLGAGFRVI